MVIPVNHKLMAKPGGEIAVKIRKQTREKVFYKQPAIWFFQFGTYEPEPGI